MIHPTHVAIAAGFALTMTASIPALAAPQSDSLSSEAVTLDNTVVLSNCSGSLVRFPTSQAGDAAMVLTNGHCLPDMPTPGQVLVDQEADRPMAVLDANGKSRGEIHASRLIYGTMTDTDAALYRVDSTYAELASKLGAHPYTLAASRPADGIKITIPSSKWKKLYNCSINGFVATLREDQWSMHDSIRYNFPGCKTIHGTSGSPIISNDTHEVVGVNNTGNDDGKMCTMDNPCEVADDGTTKAVKGQSYGQQTYWFTTCVNASNTLDLSVAGCKLPGATGAAKPSEPAPTNSPSPTSSPSSPSPTNPDDDTWPWP